MEYTLFSVIDPLMTWILVTSKQIETTEYEGKKQETKNKQTKKNWSPALISLELFLLDTKANKCEKLTSHELKNLEKVSFWPDIKRVSIVFYWDCSDSI